MLLPAILLGGVGVHLAILWRQKHTQFPGPGKTEENVVGKSFWPSQVFKSSGLMLLTAAVLALIGGLVQINPVWTYGPFIPTTVSAPAQPDWYIGWIEGALRLFPPIEFTALGITIPSPFIPGVLLPGIAFAVITVWPFVERRFLTHDHRFHELLDRPRDNALRTSLGVAALLVFVVATLAGSNDVLAVILNVPVETMTNVLRVLIFLVPIVGFLLTWRICHELQREASATLEPPKRVVLRRTPDGGFEEVETVE
jgi:ubiquinol-cytochrome c reductase cytochrome b subunit